MTFKGHKSLEYCCLVNTFDISTISYAESNGGIFVLTGRIKPEIRQSPRLIGKKTFLEKRNSENMKGLFLAACLSKVMNRWNRNQF
jgi:hypothetical protein